jgi:glycine/serine hydroxymethyltransferase
METVAGLVDRTLNGDPTPDDLGAVKAEVAALCQRFPVYV